MTVDRGMDRGPERLARAGLCSVIEQGDRVARRMFGAMAATEAWERLRAGGPEVGPWHDLVQAADPERDLDDAAAIGTRFVVPGDDEWPGHLDALANLDSLGSIGGLGGLGRYVGPPYGLWVCGDANLRQVLSRSIAIVGTRMCSHYGADVTDALVSGLVDDKITVVSSGQTGIAGLAHRAALMAGGLTVAIRAAGIGVRDLDSDPRLLARIADEGILVSEKPPGCPPNSMRQFARNRLIAAGTVGTLVTEANPDSEALNVAEWAEACRRPVLAVPGPITSPASAGTHWLIREHQAHLVTGVSDVFDALPRARTRDHGHGRQASTMLNQRAKNMAQEIADDRHPERDAERRAGRSAECVGQPQQSPFQQSPSASQSQTQSQTHQKQSRAGLLGGRVVQRSHLATPGRVQPLGNDNVIEGGGQGIEP